jgi:hypothetical protein
MRQINAKTTIGGCKPVTCTVTFHSPQEFLLFLIIAVDQKYTTTHQSNHSIAPNKISKAQYIDLQVTPLIHGQPPYKQHIITVYHQTAAQFNSYFHPFFPLVISCPHNQDPEQYETFNGLEIQQNSISCATPITRNDKLHHPQIRQVIK